MGNDKINAAQSKEEPKRPPLDDMIAGAAARAPKASTTSSTGSNGPQIERIPDATLKQDKEIGGR